MSLPWIFMQTYLQPGICHPLVSGPPGLPAGNLTAEGITFEGFPHSAPCPTWIQFLNQLFNFSSNLADTSDESLPNCQASSTGCIALTFRATSHIILSSLLTSIEEKKVD